jgi:hypothetical protein
MEKQKKKKLCRAQWFKSVIPATWKVEIGKIKLQGQPGQKLS